MLLFTIATCCIVISAGFKVSNLKKDGDNEYQLEWPERYTVKVTQTILNSGLVEDITAWISDSSSRVDYNHGAVSVITLLSDDESSKGEKYEIHPETTKDEYNKIICHGINATGRLDDILPYLGDEADDYTIVGTESIRDRKAIKFEAVEDDGRELKLKTIWADYEEEWIPIRFEEKKYLKKLGALTGHAIYEYYDFSYDFDDDVFDIEEFGCDEYIQHDRDSKAVTQSLLFIDPENQHHVDHVFKSFQNKFQRQYSHEEHHLRRSLFHNSMRLVSSVNRKNLGYKLSINEFADRTPEEMKRHKGLLKRPEGKHGNIPFPYTEASLKEIASDLPTEYDLRILGLVSPVKNQGTCGSCWAFASTAATEGALAKINGGRMMSLATQAIIDCDWNNDATGCDGGWDNAAYEWMMDNGLPTEEEYGSYENADGYCNIRNMTKLYPIRGYTDVTPSSTEALKVALVNHGPLSVSIDSSDKFDLYDGGIFYDDTCEVSKANHEVALVGYGVKDGVEFWILKNSWGPSWGIDGYIHIKAQDNLCGIETQPKYVVF